MACSGLKNLEYHEMVENAASILLTCRYLILPFLCRLVRISSSMVPRARSSSPLSDDARGIFSQQRWSDDIRFRNNTSQNHLRLRCTPHYQAKSSLAEFWPLLVKLASSSQEYPEYPESGCRTFNYRSSPANFLPIRREVDTLSPMLPRNNHCIPTSI